ncbi:hypothetical protein HDU98_003780 [Podochytrium sp. JEL0797]|nr:hypothetical protein HDU98_003780 [Podochytrium sp. JEL0797]
MHSFMNDTCPLPPKEGHHLSPSNVAIGFLLILVNAGIASFLGLHITQQLFISAFRCVLQLSLLGLVLKPVFESDSIPLVFLLALGMATLSSLEICFNKTKARFIYMLPVVWVVVVVTAFLGSFLGNAYAIQAAPWYEARQYIPILGMLLGNSLSAVSLGLNSALTQLETHKDKIEMYLSFGASRWEAVQPVARESIKTALLQTITQMSVMGLIAIPGMMTGQILGGADIDDAVRYQQIIMFMIASSSSMAVTAAVVSCLYICVDEKCRLRLDRVIKNDKKSGAGELIGRMAGKVWEVMCCCFVREQATREERRPLVGSGSN